jgi:hypothetical protein
MNSLHVNRVNFFSKENLLCGHNLSLAEPILRGFDRNRTYDVNDVIELYQIKLYIDQDLFLQSWTENDIAEFKGTVKEIWNVISKFWTNINETNVATIFNKLEIGNQRSFWSLIEKFKTYKYISEGSFNKILNSQSIWIREVLHQKNLVNYYGNVIRQYLMNYEKSAELILSEYEEKHTADYSNLLFPNCLTLEDKELIISKYLERQNVNLNFIRLIVNSRDSQDFKLSPQIRLKAIKAEKEKNDEVLHSGFAIERGIQVSISDTQVEPIKVSQNENLTLYSYSMLWLEQHSDSLSLFHNFGVLFKFVDPHYCIKLISKNQELDILEKVLMQSKNDYPVGMSFFYKNNLSHAQILIYSDYLKHNKSSLENILTNFVREYLSDSLKVKGFTITFPSENTSNLEKVRMIAPEFEFLLKQYKAYVVNGKIDHELLQISSSSIQFKDLPSILKKKYVYAKNEKLQSLQYAFFSDQSMLWYVKPFQNRYKNLFSLLVQEDVSLANFEKYQRPSIEKFIEDGYLTINSSGFVKIQQYLMLFIIGKLYLDEVISYWHSPTEIRKEIDKMQESEMIYFGETLFSVPEQKYFNYFLNKAEFTNGLDLRNRYLHGSNKDSDQEHKNSYLFYLKILILTLLKIEDDLMLAISINN